MCVDAGQTTDSELRAWGVAHAPLWAALRARTFAWDAEQHQQADPPQVAQQDP